VLEQNVQLMIRGNFETVPCNQSYVPAEREMGRNEKATRQQGGLFSRENSSNGALKSVKTFCDKSYESKNGGVKGFL